jgi:hypothetical protein
MSIFIQLAKAVNVIKHFWHNLHHFKHLIIRVDIDYADCGVIIFIFMQLATAVNVIKLFWHNLHHYWRIIIGFG